MCLGAGKWRWAAAWIVWWLLPLTLRAQQTAGSVDPSFGASLGLSGQVENVVVQPDGKILVVGQFKRGIVRLDADSSIDAGFTPTDDGKLDVSVAALQPDGKILIIGDAHAHEAAGWHAKDTTVTMARGWAGWSRIPPLAPWPNPLLP